MAKKNIEEFYSKICYPRLANIDDKLDELIKTSIENKTNIAQIKEHLQQLNGQTKENHAEIDALKQNQSKVAGILIAVGAGVTILINFVLKFLKL